MKVRVLVALGLVLGAMSCSSDPAPDAADTTVPEPATADAGSDEASDAGSEGPAEAAPVEWVESVPGGDCRCADGSEFRLYTRATDPEKVMLYFQGGGACFSAETCTFEDGTYLPQVEFDPDEAPEGILDPGNPANPFADWSIVFVPYCTGDVHIGGNVHDYGDGLTVNHVGFVNATAGLDLLVDEFPDATEVFVTGSSAGGVPSPLFAGLVADELPDARVTALADASGAYPDNPPVNAAIGSLWGSFANAPDWPENEGLTPEDYSIPGLFTQTGLHNPAIRLARYDNAYDDVQQQFSELAAVGGGDLLTVIQANEAGIEAAGVPVDSYIAPGTDHTILLAPEVYTLEVEGVAFIDWLAGLVAGDDLDDVVCTECGAPAG